ncbi:nitrite and sulphite reductase 4Fe-4S region [Methanohalobium evestigatum Z-7303]|uniref:Nitrite and sulphite reductase 4Fe-4S region n=1 Tax=Methanohalobium evestigatum (strain ATCC BAA-1072 / DSM 3721 / NBRC 107634 / OCM 161 / Z-7303) TaxID=644295 RepID=D7E6W5_METEZ|nr:Coenzyme F420 hydrogenase/dehydrogenase, beta subunit C-terminal domain [Methanohalobium evestigatum]ADI73589.1 nitrite and sulphite reductase 4Fe-4S region [Methanohalobium evestigatum Z-7303]
MYEWKLKDEIVDNGMCARCGTCAVVCPNDLLDFKNGPVLKDECLRKGHGMCLEVCPRVSSGKYQISIRENFKEEYYAGRGNFDGQDGGVVTAFLKYLLDNEKIEGAIVVGDECWKPVSMVVKDEKGLMDTAKSKYTISTLDALRDAGEMGLENVAVVGLPCQINGLRKLQYFEYLAKHGEELGSNGKPANLPDIQYLIGLFCTEKFEYDSLKNILQKYNVDIENVEKFDILKGKLVAYSNKKNASVKIPLDEIDITPGCRVCRDFDANMADVSVGSAGSSDGYSTVVVRTEKGDDIKNAIELHDEINLDAVSKLKNIKSERFNKEIKRRKEYNEPVSLYWLAEHGGVSKRADDSYFIRIRAKPSGWYEADEIEYVSKIAEEYNGKLKLTNRGGIEIHDISGFDAEEVALKLKNKGLLTGSEGPLVRATLACPGEGECGSGLINTTRICELMEDEFTEKPEPYKFKIAVSGCPNKCVRPHIHDIGFYGVRYPKVNDNCNGCGRCADVCKLEAISVRGTTSYTNYNVCIGCGKCIKACPNDARDIEKEGYMALVGGKSGREIVEATNMGMMGEDELVDFVNGVMKVYEKYADKPQRERLSSVMEKIGKGSFLSEVKDFKKEMDSV